MHVVLCNASKIKLFRRLHATYPQPFGVDCGYQRLRGCGLSRLRTMVTASIRKPVIVHSRLCIPSVASLTKSQVLENHVTSHVVS